MRAPLDRLAGRFTGRAARARSVRVRQDYLARVGSLLEAPPDAAAMLAQTTALAVPDMADISVVDLMGEDGSITDLAVDAADPAAADAIREMRRLHPIAAGGPHPAAHVARTGTPLLLPALAERDLRRFTESDEQARLLLALGIRSAIIAPLIARGRTLGAISLLRIGPAPVPYDAEDLRTVGEVARRAALALDSARLFGELTAAEARMEAILTNLAEAVTVQRPDGELVFANEAAAELLGFESPEAILATPLSEFFRRYVVLDEHGGPVDPALLPGRQALAGVDHPEPLLTRSVLRTTGVEKWVMTKARPVRDEHGAVTLAVNVMEEVTDLRRSEREQRLLAAASKVLHTSLDVEETLRQAAEAAVPDLADWCCVDVPDERGRLVRRALAAAPEKLAGLDAMRAAMTLSGEYPDAPARVLADHRPRLLTSISDDDLRALAADAAGLDVLRHAAVRSMLTVPLMAGDRAIGLMTFGTDTSARRLGPDDVALAAELGRRAGIAVENARVHATRTQIALTLQRSLLPPRLPVIPGLSIAARFRAAGTDEAERVGGDFYDLFPSGDGWFVVIGDVTGKGPEAAAITSLARYTMRTAAVYEAAPAQVLSRLNDALATDPDHRRLLTALCVRVDPSTDADAPVSVTVACAGHPPPLRLAPGRDAEPVAVGGPLLGAFEDAAWTEQRLELPKGEALLLFTDGVTDARGTDGRFGMQRLQDLGSTLGHREADAIAGGVDEALLAFEDGPQRDDVALLVLRSGSAVAVTTIVGEAPPGPLAGGL